MLRDGQSPVRRHYSSPSGPNDDDDDATPRHVQGQAASQDARARKQVVCGPGACALRRLICPPSPPLPRSPVCVPDDGGLPPAIDLDEPCDGLAAEELCCGRVSMLGPCFFRSHSRCLPFSFPRSHLQPFRISSMLGCRELTPVRRVRRLHWPELPGSAPGYVLGGVQGVQGVCPGASSCFSCVGARELTGRKPLGASGKRSLRRPSIWQAWVEVESTASLAGRLDLKQ